MTPLLPYLRYSEPLLISERAQKTCEITSTARWTSTSSIDTIATAATSSINTFWTCIYGLSPSAYTCTYTHVCNFRFGFVIKKAVHIGSSTRWNSYKHTSHCFYCRDERIICWYDKTRIYCESWFAYEY
jgi:hypothetical protein